MRDICSPLTCGGYMEHIARYKNGAAICRCSQPLRGLSKRSAEDEALIQGIHAANPNSSQTFIVDTRPKVQERRKKERKKKKRKKSGSEGTRMKQDVSVALKWCEEKASERENESKQERKIR